ncbi:MAG: MBL fold metallo-hydrolase [Syntrophotalea acetylenica]|jgi:phosphoribosyl 1,2-cyclic phosphodiesterase|nr:MBL fold metallo-hydrolase [Syntrophotalea acetylenica]
MQVRFWGVRGSIPTPGPETVRYGGNTSCIEVLSTSRDRVILDAGTGIRQLGLRLARHSPLQCAVFITHTHWDHIQGLPFFAPLFIAGNRLALHAPPDPVNRRGAEVVLESQLAYPHYPVREAELQADVEYVTLREGQCVEHGDLRVTSVLMNHPALNYGYRVEEASTGRSMFFTGDHEPRTNIYPLGSPDYQEYRETILERRAHIDALVRGVDLLVVDAQYTEEEYPDRVGWGHGNVAHAVGMMRRTNAGRLLLTHHDPARTDAELDSIVAHIGRTFPGEVQRIGLASEGYSLFFE